MKERLTGAIILVALLVLLVPELLTGPESSSPAKPAGPEGAPLRSYTIDLADDAGRAPPATVPAAEASDEPVASAKPESEATAGTDTARQPNEVPVDEAAAAASATGPPRGSGADPSAAGPAVRPDSGPAASAEPERPQSAFGPNAMSRAQPAAKAAPPKAAVAKAEASKPPPVKTDAAVSEPPGSESAKAGSVRAEGSKGWAIQLGVFASRDNAERLAKQVKGKGYPVVVNEIAGNGKRLYRVRVGPEAEHDAAVALGAKLRAAGHGGTVVPYP